jgi:hypothetical protein
VGSGKQNPATRDGRDRQPGTTMTDDFVLSAQLSTFLDDCHDIASELDVSGLSQKEVETQINRTSRALQACF